MQFDDALVDRPAEEGAREVALALLRQSDAAARRLAGGEDGEALHDLRVGVRRLRTALRALGPWLEGSARPRDERRLRKIARASNAARDAEVHLAYLANPDPAWARGGAGLDLVRGRLEARRGEGFDAARMLRRYARISRKLAARLPRYEVRLDGAPPAATFAAALASATAEQLAAVRARAAAIAGAGDERHVHRTRIAVKRLRYLLEPLRGNRHADGRAAVAELKRLQDVLGDLHDAHALGHELEEALLEVSRERAHRQFEAVYGAGASGAALRQALRGPRAGVLALARAARERRDALFGELQRTWLSGGLDALATAVERLGAALEARAGGRSDLDRRWLLSVVPPRAAALPAVEVVVGWLPGEPIRERVRRVRSDDGGDRFWRDFAQGGRASRVHAEEETTREVFEALWPLTAGRREARRRREVREGDAAWWIDELPDRGLVVAEAQLPPHAAGAPLPEWLAPFVLSELPAGGDAPAEPPGDAAAAHGAPADGGGAAAAEGPAAP